MYKTLKDCWRLPRFSWIFQWGFANSNFTLCIRQCLECISSSTHGLPTDFNSVIIVDHNYVPCNKISPSITDLGDATYFSSSSEGTYFFLQMVPFMDVTRHYFIFQGFGFVSVALSRWLFTIYWDHWRITQFIGMMNEIMEVRQTNEKTRDSEHYL